MKSEKNVKRNSELEILDVCSHSITPFHVTTLATVAHFLTDLEVKESERLSWMCVCVCVSMCVCMWQ